MPNTLIRMYQAVTKITLHTLDMVVNIEIVKISKYNEKGKKVTNQTKIAQNESSI